MRAASGSSTGNGVFRLPLLGYDITLSSLLLTILAIFLITRVQKLLKGLRAVNYLPGKVVPFQPFDIPGALFPSTWWNIGLDEFFVKRYSWYKQYHDKENVSVVPFLKGIPCIVTRNLDVARQITLGGHRSDFGKPYDTVKWTLHWGMNLLAAEEETWRRHRRIVGPAFGNELYKSVWKHTLATYQDMLSVEGWNSKGSAEIPVFQRLSSKFALLIICKCGFGLDYNWSEPPQIPGQRMSFQEAVRIVADAIIPIAVLPKWFIHLPFPSLKIMRHADKELMDFLYFNVTEKQKNIASPSKANQYDEDDDGKDIFTLLVKANKEESGKLQLDQNELIGNVFIMLFAGHETTSNTFATALSFLAINPDIQEEIFEQISSVVGLDRDPTFEDYSKLDKVLATFYEALRMYPPAYSLMRETTVDTILTIPNPPGEEGSTALPVQKGTRMLIDNVGVHYNTRYFDEPEKFKPSRWYGVSIESEMFAGFGVGPRACIGRKFATTEGVCFLTALLRDWKIEPLLKPRETVEQWSEKIFTKPRALITLGVGDVPIRLTRRT